MKKFIPLPQQAVMIDHLVKHKRCALWAEMGLGKTAAVLRALMRLAMVYDDMFPALVVAPLRVAQTTWPDEGKKWEQFRDLKIVPITGSVDDMGTALSKPAHIYTINYEQIPNLVKLFGKKWPFKAIIADESTRLKGFRIRQGTKRSKELYKVAWPYCNWFWELTGTPAPQGLQDLYGPTMFLDQGDRLGRTFTSFEQRWFKPSWNGFGLDPLPHAQEEIQERLSDICLSVRAADYFDLEKPIVNTIRVTLPPKARKLYDEMERDMFITIEEEGIEAFSAGAKRVKCMQLAQGAIYSDDTGETWKEIHNEKIEALKSIVAESGGMPILVSYNFRSDLRRLCDAFPKGRALDKDPKTIINWNAGKIPLLFAHPASAGHGLNLQTGGNILVYFAHSDNLENHLQIAERIGPVRQMQSGNKRPVFHHHIVAADTVEEYAVLPNLQGKGELQDLLMEAMKARKR